MRTGWFAKFFSQTHRGAGRQRRTRGFNAVGYVVHGYTSAC
jgi:hypothetical protein